MVCTIKIEHLSDGKLDAFATFMMRTIRIGIDVAGINEVGTLEAIYQLNACLHYCIYKVCVQCVCDWMNCFTF